jgi:hypothetical protein
VHDDLILALNLLHFLLSFEIFETVDLWTGWAESLPRRHISLGVSETLYVQLVFPKLAVVVKRVIAHLLL